MPYVHVEASVEGKRVDPTDWTPRLLPGRPIVDPGASLGNRDDDWLSTLQMEAANQAEDAGRFDEALGHLEERLKVLAWETGETGVYRRIAQIAAEKGDYARAVAAQRTYIERLALEIQYAEGALPDPRLGPIAAVGSVKSLLILKNHADINLDAYEHGSPTVVHD
jgi:hypothetical protein